MATYEITHRTEYKYSDPVSLCRNLVRLRPRSDGNVRVAVSELSASPPPSWREAYVDYFGNPVDVFTIDHPHRKLRVSVHSTVTVAPPVVPAIDPFWNNLLQTIRTSTMPIDVAAREFSYPSPRLPADADLSAYAKFCFDANPGLLAAVDALTRRINREFAYDTTATDVSTSPAAAFKLKAGVCQDFAHVQIAALRGLGVPARYVSGYLRTIPPEGQKRLIGADESHAWISVYAGSQIGWVDFDPTNACRCGTDHIPIAWGRDYDDVSPMRGIVTGGGEATLSVSVDVRPVPLVTTGASV